MIEQKDENPAKRQKTTDIARALAGAPAKVDRCSFRVRHRFKKIDFHGHILPKRFEALQKLSEENNYGKFVSLKFKNDDPKADKATMFKSGKFFRDIESNCWSPEKRIQDMNRDGVRVQVLSTVPVMFGYWAKPEHGLQICQIVNDDMVDTCKKYPKRFVALASLPMQDPKLAIQELERVMKLPGVVGVQLGSHIDSEPHRNLDNTAFYPLWAAVERLNATVLIHPWAMMGMDTMPEYWLPWLVSMPAETSRAICCLHFGGIFEKFPKIKFVFAHSGGSWPATIGRIEHGFRCRPDLTQTKCKINPRDYCGHFWIDCITHDAKVLKYNIDLLGEDKVVLGSDYPFPLGECFLEDDECGYWPGKLVTTAETITNKQRQMILWDNPLKLVGKKASDFLEE